ncbi:alpha/beta hydrolase [Streptomyces sp. AV19]|uniref:alpha/beta hydrolase family protein n=1 Tax=Streptomyces sp. AV19 TaxID=2793068 RepID=UPI0018FE8535|nr:alpha/beta hydrolase [Streptomyces sp. AV19]MBH1935802.1 alpha/beta hydrolase [Streptomyces sp. AV19]MDG4536104.1 alpha/beta hydrolase [Streptomyces sp. AV19]
MTRLLRTTAAAALALCAAFAAPGAALASPHAAPGTRVRAAAAAESAQLPRATGPYAVGRTSLHLTDHGRKDPWVPEAGDRELMVDVFYPARRGTGTPAPYATTEEIRQLLASQGLESVPPEAMSRTRIDSRVGARPAGGRHPLVVLSPGFTVARYTLTALAEELTSRGYVVAAVDHAYEAVGAAFGDRVLPCAACEKAKTPEAFHNLVTGRAKDVSFVLDRLTGPRAAWPYARMIDEKRIGMAGHSIGGAGAAAAMAADGRVRAGVNMDGAFQGAVPAGGIGGRPFMMLGTDDAMHRPGGQDTSWDETWPRLGGWKRWLTVDRADHFTFTDVPVFAEQVLPPSFPRPELSADRSVAITRAYTAAFFDRHLKHLPQPLLDGPSPANPEVRFNNPLNTP